MKQQVKCPNCKYKWETKSKLDSITCPNCQKKFNKQAASKLMKDEK